MPDLSRRTLIRRAAAVTGAAVVASVAPPAGALAATAGRRSRHGDLRDIQHVMILMQENRSFDHYFGSLRGVRGFGDRATITLPGGYPVWQQPTSAPGQPIGEPSQAYQPVPEDGSWSRRYAGHLENGRPSITG